MSADDVYQYLCGALAIAAAIAGLFFLRYWAVSRDRFFVFFTIAFWMMGCNWTVSAALKPTHEAIHYVYFVRLTAFVLLIAAIIDKNRKR